MKLVISLFFLFYLISSSAKECSLSQKIISFSGPVTDLLSELNLLADKKLMGISTFHSLKSTSNVTLIPGGLFLSRKKLRSMSESLIFFDKSLELSKQFELEQIKAIEVDTRGVDPFLATERILIQIEKVLNNCQSTLKAFRAKIDDIKSKLESKTYAKKMIFFLGEISTNGKLPELAISNDGAILFLKKHGLKSYQSDLAYARWSAKHMKSYKDYLLIGLSSKMSDEIIKSTISAQKINLSFRGVLTPGVRQIYFLDKLAHQFFN